MASAEDPFEAAKANIRDTVKWLTATFAALAAVVIGGSPVSGLGALSVHGPSFWIGVACLLAAFACICAALHMTLGILRPEVIFRSDLYIADQGRRSPSDWSELTRIRSLINTHARDLLPYNYPTLDSLGRELETWADILALEDPDPIKLEEARKMVEALTVAFERVLVFAQYLRLQMRLQDAQRALLWLGIGALVSLTAFGVVINSSPKAPDTPPSIVVIESPPATR